ncbi:hypothetical protein [Conexibacter sp. DBS9H8]|uniref:hypothetical protein n=1 Tax=Conexibacter sp. DBS9H8 TaxID=2937801 RepID=UPI00200E52D5|nr:hypothetical protein [Conexibacter sp. DBS9H8]
MSGLAPALLAAAAGVGFGHAVLPDHWVPLAVLGRTRSYPIRRVGALAVGAGLAHVAVSVILGGVVLVIGLSFRSLILGVEGTVVGGLLILTGLVFLVLEFTGHGHGHGHGHDHGHDHDHDDDHDHGHGRDHDHDHDDDHDHGHGCDHVGARRGGALAVVVPFGAAASPDLTILPVFLAATAAGTVTAVGTLVVFSAVTVTTIVALTVLAFLTGHRLSGGWLDRWGNALSAAVLITIGTLIAGGVI